MKKTKILFSLLLVLSGIAIIGSAARAHLASTTTTVTGKAFNTNGTPISTNVTVTVYSASGMLITTVTQPGNAISFNYTYDFASESSVAVKITFKKAASTIPTRTMIGLAGNQPTIAVGEITVP